MVLFPITNLNNRHILLHSIIIILAYLIVVIQSQGVPQNNIGVEMLNKTLIKYNRTLELFSDVEKKMVKITLNIALRIRYRAMKTNKINIDKKVLKIKEELSKKENNNQKIIDDINSVGNDMKNFEKKYKVFIDLYNECEKTKNYFAEFLKIFFITLLIIVIIVLSLIGIISLFVIKKQRKYYQLQEEVVIGEEKDESRKVDLNGKYNIAKKIIKESTDSNQKYQESHEISPDQKIHIKTSSNLTSHDEINKNP
jgi:hypothetical protein